MEVILLFALLVKHAIADLAIQSARTISYKGNYFSKGLHVHAMDHGVLTAVVLLFFINPLNAIIFGILDYIVHAIIDCNKTKALTYFNIPREGNIYWSVQTLDQILHYTTYLIIVLMVL